MLIEPLLIETNGIAAAIIGEVRINMLKMVSI
jgi:hypothetical protein